MTPLPNSAILQSSVSYSYAKENDTMNVAIEPIRHSTLSRAEVLVECARAAIACWNHYADEPLPEEDQYPENMAHYFKCWFPLEATFPQTKQYRKE